MKFLKGILRNKKRNGRVGGFLEEESGVGFTSRDVWSPGKHLTVQALTITFTSITCYIFTTSYIFFHSPFFFYRQYMGYHQTIHRWKYILKMADHRFLLQHFSPSQSPAAPLCNDQTSCICKTKGLWWKKTLVSFTRGQKGAKCGTLTAKNTSTCSAAMDPTSLVTGTRWGTLRSRIRRSGWKHLPRKTSRARRRTLAIVVTTGIKPSST